MHSSSGGSRRGPVADRKLATYRAKRDFTEDDIVVREFLPNSSRALVRKGKFCAA